MILNIFSLQEVKCKKGKKIFEELYKPIRANVVQGRNYSSRFEIWVFFRSPLETQFSAEEKTNNPTHLANNYQNQTQSLNTLHEEELFP